MEKHYKPIDKKELDSIWQDMETEQWNKIRKRSQELIQENKKLKQINK